MNLLSLIEQLGKVEEAPLPQLEPARCLRQLDRTSGCSVCVDLCPADTISFGDEPGSVPQIDVEACQLCMACLPACPTSAFTAADAVPDLVRCAGRLRSQHLEVLCFLQPEPESGPGEAAIRVRSCLAGLGSAAYLALAAEGVPAVTVRTDACVDCPWAGLQNQVEAQLAEAQTLLDLWQAPMVLSTSGVRDTEWVQRPWYRAESPPVSRRALAQMGREEQTEGLTPGTQPFHQRLRTVRSLQTLPPPEEAPGARLPAAAGFALVYVDERCNACGTCARVCPSSTLELEVTDGRFQLTFAPQACLGCDLCARLCPEEAIRIQHEPAAAHVFGPDSLYLLREGPARRCARCNAPFAPRTAEATHCDICEFRRHNRFGAKMPPGMAGRALAGRHLRKESD